MQKKDEVMERLFHLASGFENKLARLLPVKYVYTTPGKFLFINDEPVLDYITYTSVSTDMSSIPKGMSKYAFYDRCRDALQNDLITKISSDKINNKTFIMTLRPQIQADKERISLHLGGRWFPRAGIKEIQPPIDVEEPFPYHE